MNRRDFLSTLALSAGFGHLAACKSPTSAKPGPAMSDGPRQWVTDRFVTLGINKLAENDFAPLKGRRVGFINNQTSVSGQGLLSRRILQLNLGADLVSLFGPEHGLDTRTRAGDFVANAVDPVTGLRALSLYGPTRKPTPQMLADLDVVVFEIQDIGVRSYTYISTMALAMEACGEAGKDFVVLDRPNPLGGVHVQGPPMEEAYRSFVGQIPIPYRHGMTIGELAQMIIAKGWIKANPRLTVIPMYGWQRNMTWAQTTLSWVPTSPNIPNQDSPFYCAATGILGELREVDIGIGTDKPFHYAAARGIDGPAFARFLTAQGYSGVTFKPYASTVKPGFTGVELEIDPATAADIMALGIVLIQEVVRRSSGAALQGNTASNLDLFTKVYGSPALSKALTADTPAQDLIESWQTSNAAFKRDRAPYLLY
jgi:uncharacterized protein YbbC (DUF1343 family)